MPASSAGIAAVAVDTKQALTLLKQPTCVSKITEITILWDSGFMDIELEKRVRACVADAIVYEVTLKMAKAVAKPIPLKAG